MTVSMADLMKDMRFYRGVDFDVKFVRVGNQKVIDNRLPTADEWHAGRVEFEFRNGFNCVPLMGMFTKYGASCSYRDNRIEVYCNHSDQVMDVISFMIMTRDFNRQMYKQRYQNMTRTK